jgi:hypothetical protein
MATSRIYYQNLLTATTFDRFVVTGSAVAQTTIPATQAYSLYHYNGGNVSFVVQGIYTGEVPRDYVVQVTNAPDDQFSTARYRWSDSDGVTWNEEDLTPLSATPKALSHGVEIIFTASSLAPEFIVGDEWDFRALRPYGILQALDGSRNSDYRSGDLPSSSSITCWWDLGTAQTPGFIGLMDHNIPSTGATITLLADGTSPAEPADASQAVTWRNGFLADLVTIGPFRYWGLKVAMTSGSLSFLRFSELFLGTGVTLSKPFNIGFTQDREPLTGVELIHAAIGPVMRVRTARRRVRTWSQVKMDATEDGGKLDAVRDALEAHSSYTEPPFWFIPLDNDLAATELNGWAGGLAESHRILDRYDYRVEMLERIRTVA